MSQLRLFVGLLSYLLVMVSSSAATAGQPLDRTTEPIETVVDLLLELPADAKQATRQSELLTILVNALTFELSRSDKCPLLFTTSYQPLILVTAMEALDRATLDHCLKATLQLLRDHEFDTASVENAREMHNEIVRFNQRAPLLAEMRWLQETVQRYYDRSPVRSAILRVRHSLIETSAQEILEEIAALRSYHLTRVPRVAAHAKFVDPLEIVEPAQSEHELKTELEQWLAQTPEIGLVHLVYRTGESALLSDSLRQGICGPERAFVRLGSTVKLQSIANVQCWLENFFPGETWMTFRLVPGSTDNFTQKKEDVKRMLLGRRATNRGLNAQAF